MLTVQYDHSPTDLKRGEASRPLNSNASFPASTTVSRCEVDPFPLDSSLTERDQDLPLPSTHHHGPSQPAKADHTAFLSLPARML
jgi:hypothetical protein